MTEKEINANENENATEINVLLRSLVVINTIRTLININIPILRLQPRCLYHHSRRHSRYHRFNLKNNSKASFILNSFLG